jgi:hypothetical protein
VVHPHEVFKVKLYRFMQSLLDRHSDETTGSCGVLVRNLAKKKPSIKPMRSKKDTTKDHTEVGCKVVH